MAAAGADVVLRRISVIDSSADLDGGALHVEAESTMTVVSSNITSAEGALIVSHVNAFLNVHSARPWP